jgi:hypothetical protein
LGNVVAKHEALALKGKEHSNDIILVCVLESKLNLFHFEFLLHA